MGAFGSDLSSYGEEKINTETVSKSPCNHFIKRSQVNGIRNEKGYFMTNKTIGSVMVIGGGIAGIQASLDLADSGYYVYLVESSSSIGGMMSQLDKTFPTNDCAM